MKIRSKSLYMKLLRIYIFVLIPLFLIGAIFIYNHILVSRNNIHMAVISSGNLTTEYLESRVVEIRDKLQLMITERDTILREFYIKYNSYSNSEYWSTLRHIWMNISMMQANNPLIDEIILYYPQQNIMVSTIWGVSIIDKTKYTIERDSILMQKGIVNVSDKHAVIGRIYPAVRYSSHDDQDIYILLVARLSSSAISSVLSEGMYGIYPTFLIQNDTNLVIGSNIRTPENKSSTATDDSKFAQNNILHHNLFQTESLVLNCTVARYIPDNIIWGMYRRFIVIFGTYLVFSMTLILSCALGLRSNVQRPISELLHAFKKMQEGNLNYTIQYKSDTLDFISLIDGFNNMVTKLNELIIKSYRMESYAKQMELKHLQSQINPHFLYNSFFILKHLVMNEDTTSAVSLSNYLSQYFKYITRSDKLYIPLTDEYKHALVYLEIQKMRFGKSIDLKIMTLPNHAEQIIVPKLILQPIIENTFNHAFHNIDTVFIFDIHFQNTEDSFYIHFDDNGNSLSNEQLQNMQLKLMDTNESTEITGMINIHRRLQIFYGINYGISLSRSAIGGLHVAIKLPYPKQEQIKTISFGETP